MNDYPNHFMLNGSDWTIQSEDPAAQTFPATVPGNIQADLERAHALNPLWYGAGDERLYDVPEKRWTYRKTFTAPDSPAGRRVRLMFAGVDMECEVRLNGRVLGRHDGMFEHFGFDVGKWLHPGETNELVITLAPMPPGLKEKLIGSDGPQSGVDTPGYFIEGMNTLRQQTKRLKSPTNWGWDWGVSVYTLGIWKDVWLAYSGHACIEWLQVRTTLSDDHPEAVVSVALDIDSLMDVDAEVHAVARLGDRTWEASSPAKLSAGAGKVTVEFSIADPELWWPSGQGEQTLYTLEAYLEDAASGERLDAKSSRFGIRDIRWQPVEGAPADFPNPFQLVINGRVVRTMGSNLIPPDLLFGRIQDKGVRLVRQAKEAGMNWLRMWGGGVIMPDSFYDAADEAGILLSQEYPLACCMPEEDDELLANVEVTVRNILKQLRNHPCIAEWGGGNEMYWEPNPEHRLLKLLEQVTAEEDDRIFRTTCPIKGSRHNPWWYYPESHYRHYDEWDAHRYGEFGCQTPAHLEVWQREIPSNDRWPIEGVDNPILTRKNVVQAVFSDKFWLVQEVLDNLFGPAKNLPQLIRAGQFIGAEGLRYAMDAMRRMGRRLAGFSSWDYNEPWPNGAGSYLIDYDGRPLMNYHFVKQALMPVSLTLKHDAMLVDPAKGIIAGVWLVSDVPGTVRNLTWRWRARDRNGNVFAEGEGKDDIEYHEPLQTDSIAAVPPPESSDGPWFVELQLIESNGDLVADRLHVFGRAGADSPLAALLDADHAHPVKRTALDVSARQNDPVSDWDELTLRLRNTGPMTALFCEPHPIAEYRTDLAIENNYVCVPPGEERTITIRATREPQGGLSLAQTGWRIECWNAEDVIIDPGDGVLLTVGRRDRMCGEFPIGNCPQLMDEGQSVDFTFEAAETTAVRLRIHTADQSADGPTVVQAVVNGQAFEQTLPVGYGFQRSDPEHLADPQTLTFIIPGESVWAGVNHLCVGVGTGWFTWDALDVVRTVEEEV